MPRADGTSLAAVDSFLIPSTLERQFEIIGEATKRLAAADPTIAEPYEARRRHFLQPRHFGDHTGVFSISSNSSGLDQRAIADTFSKSAKSSSRHTSIVSSNSETSFHLESCGRDSLRSEHPV